MTPEVPERFRHLDERRGLVAVGHRTMHEAALAVRRSVPTMDDAVRLVDEVERQLGPRGWRDPEGNVERRRVLLRDAEHPEWLVPYALVEQEFGAAPESPPVVSGAPAKKEERRAAADAWPVPVDAPEGWTWGDPDFRPRDPVPEILPTGPTMRPGTLTLGEGPAFYTLRYDARGWRRGSVESAFDQFTHLRYSGVRPYTIDPTARPPLQAPHSVLCRTDLDPDGHVLSDFARMLCESRIGERVAVRVRAPVALPGGPLGCWQRAEGRLRETLWASELPSDARWLVVDGYEAIAHAMGATLDEALGRWRVEVERVEPLPPGSRKMVALPVQPKHEPIPPEDIPEAGEYEDPDGKFKLISFGLINLQFEAPPPPPRAPGQPPVEWPPPGVESTPAVAIPIPPLPAVPGPYRAAGFTRVVRLLGAHGHVRHGFVREDAAGFLLVGEGVFDLIDPATVQSEIDTFEQQDHAWHERLPPHLQRQWDRWEGACSVSSYACWDDGHQRRAPLRLAGGQSGAEWSPQSLDGDAAGWQVVRLSGDDDGVDSGHPRRSSPSASLDTAPRLHDRPRALHGTDCRRGSEGAMTALARTPGGRVPGVTDAPFQVPPPGATAHRGASPPEAILRDPFTGQVMARVAEQAPAEVRAAVARARSAQRAWCERPVRERARVVLAWRGRILAEAEALAEALRRQTGRPTAEALLLEVLPAVHLAGHFARRAERVLAPERLRPRLLRNRGSYLVHVPRGVVGVLTSWSSPFLAPVGHAVQALLAGNAVVIKPSAGAPLPALRARELLEEAGGPRELLQVVTGGPATGAALVDAGIDACRFTGGTAVGRQVAAACGQRLVPVVLELAGKPAAVVCADADAERAARALVWGAFSHAGQGAAGVGRVYVDRVLHDELCARLVAEARRLRLGPWRASGDVDLGPLGRARHLEQVEALVAAAVAAGARVVLGGRRLYAGEREGPSALFYEPTVLVECSAHMQVMREAVAGPVLPIMAVADDEEAVREANEPCPGAVAWVFSRDGRRSRRLAERLSAGTVVVNDCLAGAASPELPWGGARQLGRVRADEALRDLSERRQVNYDRLRLPREPWWFPCSPALPRRLLAALRLLRL